MRTVWYSLLHSRGAIRGCHNLDEEDYFSKQQWNPWLKDRGFFALGPRMLWGLGHVGELLAFEAKM